MPIGEKRKLLDTRRRKVKEQLLAIEALSTADAAPEKVTEVEHALRLATLANGNAPARTEIDWLNATEQQLEGNTT